MKVTDYQIEMINVGAADAFIIYFTDDSQNNHLVLVDAGNYTDGQKIINHIRVHYTNPIIDLAIVTHPDDDHFGGFVKMVEKLRDKERDAVKINQFWLNDPGNNHIEKNEVKWINKQNSVNVRARSVYDLGGDPKKNLIDLIDSSPYITREEKFTRIGRLLDIPVFLSDPTFSCFKIIGPTKSYYERLVPNFRNDELNFHPKENDDNYDSTKDIPNGTCLSLALDKASDDTSAHNQSSIIFLFQASTDKKFLFMGDAGRDAFNNIHPLAKNHIKNISWLKVPHHGSKHNIDSGMINWIKPDTAYISTEKIGNYLNMCTVNALKASKCNVYSTHKDKSDFLHNGNRDGYGTATPL